MRKWGACPTPAATDRDGAVYPPRANVVNVHMANIATSVRIAGDAIGVLPKLSAKLGQPKAQVIETALKQLEERIFWEEVGEAFERIAADPMESARQKAEIELWDRGTARDFEGEEW